MAKDYSEDQLIQRSAAEFLEKELGWTSIYAYDNEVLGDCKSPQTVTIPFSTYFAFAVDFVPLHPQNTSSYV